MICKTYSSTPGHMNVIFELPACLWADSVSLVGDFNNWDPNATLLRQQHSGVWRAVIELPIDGRFEFRYIIDGNWNTDFHADGTTPAPNGALNSVVDTKMTVPSSPLCKGQSLVHEDAGDAGVDFLRKPRPIAA